MLKIFIYFAAFVLTCAGVEIFRRQALKRELYDVPNERSSHQTPTPRGGGIIIVLVCLFFYLLFCLTSGKDPSWSYCIAAGLIALVSFYDDLKSISILKRMFVHSIGAGLIIWQYGFWNEIYLPFAGNINPGIAGLPVTFLWIVWVTNAYNFMDGIDGLAALQAVIGGIGWLLAGGILGGETAVLTGGLTAGSALGFLIHNRSPARIFMGDVGSTFLGFTFAVLPLIVKNEVSFQAVLPFTALMILWFFVFDTVLTLSRRVLQKEKFWRAHREHLYQRLVEKRFTHNFVTVFYAFSAVCAEFFLIYGLAKNIDYLAVSLMTALAFSAFLFIFEKNIRKFCV